MKILAAIVTYNRMVLLERCIDHIRTQTRAPDGLLVINNSSPDDTVAMLEAKGVDYVTQPNVGSAGGWNRAIEAALDGGYDAVWLMDDDGYPGGEALEKLEAALTPGVACASAVVLREAQPTHFVFPFPRLGPDGLPVLLARNRKVETLAELRQLASNDIYPFAHLFNGALIRTDVARKIGNVDRRFFLMGDEVDYFMRMRREGAVVSHLDAHHLHPDVTSRPLDRAKLYYYVKNTIILNRRYFDRPAMRDALTVGVVLSRMARRNSLGEALSYAVGRNAPTLWSAVARGWRGQIGKDMPDAKEKR